MTSSLEYGKYILDYLKHRSTTNIILLKLEQVDIEFVIYHKLFVKKETFTFDEFCTLVIDTYQNLSKKY